MDSEVADAATLLLKLNQTISQGGQGSQTGQPNSQLPGKQSQPHHATTTQIMQPKRTKAPTTAVFIELPTCPAKAVRPRVAFGCMANDEAGTPLEKLARGGMPW